MDSPNLVEPGVRFYINNTLKKCSAVKNKFNYILYNFYYLVIFIFFIGGFLIFKYKGKLTSEELKTKQIKEKEIVYTNLMKINMIKKDIEKTNMITGLPLWNNNDINLNNNYLYK